MGLYSDNPSMDEILRRIKRALADRDGGDGAHHTSPRETPAHPSPSAISMREYARNPQVSRKILDGLVDDFSASNLSVRPAKKEAAKPAPMPEPPSHDGRVVVLTRKMRAVRRPDLSNADLDKFYAGLASALASAMSISYMADRIEKWLRDNMADAAEKASG